MKFAFITNVPKSVGRVRLREEAEARGHELDILSRSSVEIGPNTAEALADELSGYDLVHFAGGLGQFVTKNVQEILEARGVICPNSYSRRSTNVDNKVFQSLRFAAAGLPIPKTIRATRPDHGELSGSLGWPFVAKDPRSTQGKGVTLIRSESDLGRIDPNKEHLFQEFIEYESDYRVHVVGDVAFCAYRRMAPKDDFRANVSLGGSLEKITDPKILEELSTLALKAAAATDLDLGGIDIIRDRSGQLYLLEVNSDPGFKGVEETTSESFARPIIDYYEKKVKGSDR